jgi:hypothetical protein
VRTTPVRWIASNHPTARICESPPNEGRKKVQQTPTGRVDRFDCRESRKMERFIIAGLLLLMVSSPISAQQPTKPPQPERPANQNAAAGRPLLHAPSGPAFNIGPMGDGRNRFVMVISDENKRVLTCDATHAQVELFQAILEEAKRFAATDESRGLKRPIVTRFFSRPDKTISVDVSKLGERSYFYVNMRCHRDRLTAPLGSIKKGESDAKPVFYEMLARLGDALAGVSHRQ